ncbi:hypothetical protein EVAR_50577_1 [Eumeta japonica]|uniref:Uncharacterized protein n=1 Tax=Eumeta variegata TaxID=151549 RepID=A0A4C1Y6I3_EUMVA|nr:hypothetical protein EVAR_50577_1 [Eumeta japonica]
MFRQMHRVRRPRDHLSGYLRATCGSAEAEGDPHSHCISSSGTLAHLVDTSRSRGEFWASASESVTPSVACFVYARFACSFSWRSAKRTSVVRRAAAGVACGRRRWRPRARASGMSDPRSQRRAGVDTNRRHQMERYAGIATLLPILLQCKTANCNYCPTSMLSLYI